MTTWKAGSVRIKGKMHTGVFEGNKLICYVLGDEPEAWATASKIALMPDMFTAMCRASDALTFYNDQLTANEISGLSKAMKAKYDVVRTWQGIGK